MSLYQDMFDSLSEFRRLAILVMDDNRRDEIGSNQWPLAMMAYGLVNCNDPTRSAESIKIYARFASCCDVKRRQSTVKQLAAFISQRRGDGWRALMPMVLADPDYSIRHQAAFLIVTLSAPSNSDKFLGMTRMLDLCKTPALDGQQSCDAALDAVLNLSDLRLLPALDTFAADCPVDTLQQLIAASQAIPNALSCTWLIHLTTARPDLQECIAAQLVAMGSRAGAINDVIVPIPSWAFKGSGIQPLHSWTAPEYALRIASDCASTLSPEQITALKQSWGA